MPFWVFSSHRACCLGLPITSYGSVLLFKAREDPGQQANGVSVSEGVLGTERPSWKFTQQRWSFAKSNLSNYCLLLQEAGTQAQPHP